MTLMTSTLRAETKICGTWVPVCRLGALAVAVARLLLADKSKRATGLSMHNGEGMREMVVE